MEKPSKRAVHIVPLPEHTGMKLSKPKHVAAGVPGVLTAFKHVSKEVGFVKGMKMLSKMNQKGGFDCAGCAWPDPDGKRSSVGEYCENGAKALAEEATKKRVDAAFMARHSVEEISSWSDYKIGKSGRITEPLYLPKGESHYRPISWEKAFDLIGSELKALDNPNEAIFYTSGRTSNEAAFMYQLFVRTFGTNNLPDCSNMCHESSGSGLSQTVGIGKGSVTLEDIHQAEVIMVMGQNPGTNHPRMLTALKKCRNNGGEIISVNPLPETGMDKFKDPQSVKDMTLGTSTKIANHWLQVRVNGDVPLLKGIMRALLDMQEAQPKAKIIDTAFIEKHTHGWEAHKQSLLESDIEECAQLSGIPVEQILTVAKLLSKKSKIIICWAMGLTQHPNGVQNVRELVNLLLMRGAIGKPGAGTCPVRGHSNVQGDRTMGIWEKPKEVFLQNLDKQFGIQAPRAHGYDTVDAIVAMAENKGKVFIGMGGNFISATPDSLATGHAMQNCRFTVQVSTKLNRSHLVTGDHALILPCIARSERDSQISGEQFVSVENSMGVVHSSQGRFNPPSNHLLSEPAIIAGMAKATLPANPNINWDQMVANYDTVRDHIEAVIPGFEQYNQRVRKPEGFYLPNGARKGDFNTDIGKARFTINPNPSYKLGPEELIMMTIRSHDQYNTTIYGLDDRYRGIKSERRVVLMHPDDIASRGLETGKSVTLTSYFEGEFRKAPRFLVVSFPITKGCCATYFPEANVLVPLRSVAKISNTPTSKFVVVTIQAED